MLAILNYLNAHNSPILQPILMILVSKFMVYRALSGKTYLSLGLLSPLISQHFRRRCLYKKIHYLTFDMSPVPSTSCELCI